MARTLSLFAFLLLFWFLLSGHVDPRKHAFLMGTGVLSCALVAWMSRWMGMADAEGHPVGIWPRLALYLPWLAWQIVLANLDVARRVWLPGARIAPRMVRAPLEIRDPVLAAVYANSVTLTPGTVTVSADPEKGELLVHALTEEAEKSLLSGGMQARVAKLGGRT